MHTQLEPLDIVFRLVIFLLLCYKLRQLVKQYVIPLLYKHIATEKNQQLEILEKEKLLISTENRIENQISAQKKMFILLEKNMQLTHAFLQTKNELLEKETRLIMQKLQEKRALQKKQYTLIKTSQEVIPQTIMLAGSELTKQYHGQEGLLVLKKMISDLQNNTQAK